MLKVIAQDGSKTFLVYRYGRKYFFSNTISGWLLPLVGVDLWCVVESGIGAQLERRRELVRGLFPAIVRAETLCNGEPTERELADRRLSSHAAEELTKAHRVRVASFRFVVTVLQILLVVVLLGPFWSGRRLWGPGLGLGMVAYGLLSWVLTSPWPERSPLGDGVGS